MILGEYVFHFSTTELAAWDIGLDTKQSWKRPTPRSEVPWTLPHHSWNIWVWRPKLWTPGSPGWSVASYDWKAGRIEVNASKSVQNSGLKGTNMLFDPKHTGFIQTSSVLRKLDSRKDSLRTQELKSKVGQQLNLARSTFPYWKTYEPQLANKFGRLREQRFLWGAALLLGWDAQVGQQRCTDKRHQIICQCVFVAVQGLTSIGKTTELITQEVFVYRVQ